MTQERAHRRLAAILAADVVGYSRQMAADEAGTLARLKIFRAKITDPSIAQYNGRVVKLMGDGILAEFASIVDAVNCAIAIQQQIHASSQEADAQHIVLRIGINLGDVMVDGDDLYGDGVNMAARLQEIAEPGSIYVSGTVLEHIGRRADIAFEDCGERQVKNIDRPLRVHRVRIGAPGAVPHAPARGQDSQSERTASIAVLPFTNMSGDPSQDYFSDGITEDIITELSRFRSLFVIARNSTFAFKNQAIDIREIGRRLGVRYVVEGSVRRAGSRVRVTAQLIEAATGSHLWAERYDRELADVFEMQDEVTRQIVVNIAPRLQSEAQHLAKRRSPDDIRVYELYLRAKAMVDMPSNDRDLLQARDYCDRAIAIDPTFARAHAYRAFSFIVGIPVVEADNTDWWAEALKSAERAVSLDDLDNVCHWAIGETAFWAGQAERARRHIRRALSLNPNDADVLAVASFIEVALGDPETGLRNMAMARERNPTNPPWYHWLTGAAFAALGRYDEALAEYDQFGPPNVDVMKLRTITLVQLGRIEEARAVVQTMLALRPDLTVAKITRSDKALPDVAVRADSLRRAGMPE